jgi:hypothetical protein
MPSNYVQGYNILGEMVMTPEYCEDRNATNCSFTNECAYDYNAAVCHKKAGVSEGIDKKQNQGVVRILELEHEFDILFQKYSSAHARLISLYETTATSRVGKKSCTPPEWAKKTIAPKKFTSFITNWCNKYGESKFNTPEIRKQTKLVHKLNTQITDVLYQMNTLLKTLIKKGVSNVKIYKIKEKSVIQKYRKLSQERKRLSKLDKTYSSSIDRNADAQLLKNKEHYMYLTWIFGSIIVAGFTIYHVKNAAV